MPTADDYRYAAQRFEEIAFDVARSVSEIAGPWDHVAKGGRLAAIIDSVVGTTHDDLGAMLNRLVAMSDECKRRARVCDAYAAEIAAFRANPEPFGDFPNPPFEWVEVAERVTIDRFPHGGLR